MGVVRDVTIDQLTQAVQGISSAGMTDTTGQDIKDSIDALDMTAGTLGKDSSLQDIVTAIQALTASISPAASNVTFDNTGTDMTASNAQAAIVELNNNKAVKDEKNFFKRVAIDSPNVGYHLHYNNNDSLAILMITSTGATVSITKESGQNSNVQVIKGTLANYSLGTTDTYLRVGSGARSLFIVSCYFNEYFYIDTYS